jgi:hypothetical protein
MSDLTQVLTQQAVLERDHATLDEWNQPGPSDWQPLATVACRHWWWTQGGRGPSHEFTSPDRTVSVDEGGIVIPPDVDVTAIDRVARITDPAGNTILPGPLQILAVLVHETHIELVVRRP